MEKNPDPGSGMNIPDIILKTCYQFFGLKYLYSLIQILIWDLVNPGSGMGKSDPRFWINIPNPQLQVGYFFCHVI